MRRIDIDCDHTEIYYNGTLLYTILLDSISSAEEPSTGNVYGLNPWVATVWQA